MHDGSVLGFKDKERKEVVHSLNTSFPPFLEEFRALTWCRWNLEEMAQYKEAQKCISAINLLHQRESDLQKVFLVAI